MTGEGANGGGERERREGGRRTGKGEERHRIQRLGFKIVCHYRGFPFFLLRFQLSLHIITLNGIVTLKVLNSTNYFPLLDSRLKNSCFVFSFNYFRFIRRILSDRRIFAIWTEFGRERKKNERKMGGVGGAGKRRGNKKNGRTGGGEWEIKDAITKRPKSFIRTPKAAITFANTNCIRPGNSIMKIFPPF